MSGYRRRKDYTMDALTDSLVALGLEVTPELWATNWVAMHEDPQTVDLEAVPSEYLEAVEALLDAQSSNSAQTAS